jgi:hypothetical protein
MSRLKDGVLHAATAVALFMVIQAPVFASPFGRLFKEALDGVVESTPYFAARGARKEITKESNGEKPEDVLRAKLEAIDEETGKMANSITNIIFIYNTPEQKIVPEKEYQRIKQQFSQKIKGEKRSQTKLVFLTNLKCSAYALDLMTAFGEALSSGQELDSYQEPIRDLKRCSEILRRVKGYHPNSVDGYEKLANGFMPLFKDLRNLDRQKRQEVSLFVSTILSAMKNQHMATERAGKEWFSI